jgi:hydrogenase maturation protease
LLLPDGVRVVDYGIGGIHLACELLNGYDALVLVDTVSRDGAPGDVYVIEVDAGRVDNAQLDAHSMDPATVFASLRAPGGEPPPSVLVGCEPADLGEGIGLSPAVAAAVDVAVQAVMETLTAQLASSS